MSLRHSLPLAIVRKKGCKNLKSMLERLTQIPAKLTRLLKRTKFLYESRVRGLGGVAILTLPNS